MDQNPNQALNSTNPTNNPGSLRKESSTGGKILSFVLLVVVGVAVKLFIRSLFR